MELVLAISSVISVLAAVGAVWFAYQAVRETRTLRREDRLARLPELVEELAESAVGPSSSFHSKWVYPVKRRRLEIAVAALGEPLPACHELASSDRFADAGSMPLDSVRDQAIAALEELRRATG